MAESCELTGTLGFIVQAILGVLAFSILIIKRQYEKPKRQLKIWILDTSKQGFSQGIAHVLNVLLAIVLSETGESSGNDPCNWYFVTISLDTTVGVIICYIILNIVEYLFERAGAGRLKTGNYFRIYTPDEQMALDEFKRRSDQIHEEKLGINLIRPVIKIDYGIWGVQVFIWICVVVVSKTILYFVQLGLQGVLKSIASGLLSGLDDNPDVKLIIVMVLIPLFLNAIQFWVQDNFLKKSEFSQIEEQYLTSEMFVDLELQDILKNEDHESTSHSRHNIPSSINNNNNQNNIKKDSMSPEYEFEQYNTSYSNNL